jgi:hypothetical protein
MKEGYVIINTTSVKMHSRVMRSYWITLQPRVLFLPSLWAWLCSLSVVVSVSMVSSYSLLSYHLKKNLNVSSELASFYQLDIILVNKNPTLSS